MLGPEKLLRLGTTRATPTVLRDLQGLPDGDRETKGEAGLKFRPQHMQNMNPWLLPSSLLGFILKENYKNNTRHNKLKQTKLKKKRELQNMFNEGLRQKKNPATPQRLKLCSLSRI